MWHFLQGPKEIGDIDTDDDKDEEEQYEQWKIREMRRIRCAAEAVNQHFLQLASSPCMLHGEQAVGL